MNIKESLQSVNQAITQRHISIEAYKAEGETKDAEVKIDDDTKIDDYEINSEILRRLNGEAWIN